MSVGLMDMRDIVIEFLTAFGHSVLRENCNIIFIQNVYDGKLVELYFYDDVIRVNVDHLVTKFELSDPNMFNKLEESLCGYGK